jgi:hypothetical protein
MRSSKFWLVGSILLSVLLTIGFLSCGGGDDNPSPKKSSDAALTSVKLSWESVEKALPESGKTLPDAVKGSAWDAAAKLSDVFDDQTNVYELLLDAPASGTTLANSVTVESTAKNSKATTDWAYVNNLSGGPSSVTFGNEVVARFSQGGYLIIRVIAQDKTTINYYAVRTTSLSNITRLNSIQIEGQAAANNFTQGTHDSASIEIIESSSKYLDIMLTSAQATGKKIILTPANNFNKEKGSIKIVKIDESASLPAAAEFEAYDETKTYDFVDGDRIFIEMKAEDGTTAYYGAKIGIGADAGLESVTLETQAITPEGMGTPGSSLAAAVEGYILMGIMQTNAQGFNVAVTANDKDPVVQVTFGKAADAENTWSGTTRRIKFEDKELLGIKIVSANGKKTNYYKIRVELMTTMEINYGSPSLGENDYVDPKWDTAEWQPIANQNRAETNQEFFDNPSTSGRAKLLWDEDGLWLYVDVTTEYISEAMGSAGDHDGSNVELFINEAYPTINSGNYNNIGGQYRVDSTLPNGAVTGDPSDAATALRESGKYKMWRKTSPKGYAVMFQAPWRFVDQYPLKDDKDISLEVQINAAGPTGARIGVLKWYNTVENTYQNASALAPGKLKLGGHELGTQKPTITTQPVSQNVPIGGNVGALSVVAVSPDGGDLSFQWYSATSATGTGTLISGATNPSYTPSLSVTEVGESFYYVIVTNKKGEDRATTQSNTVRVNVYDPSTTPVDIELVNSSHAKWDATANALVIDNGTSFGAANSFTTIVELPIPATIDMTQYIRLEFDLDTYVAGAIVPVPSNQYNNNIAYTLYGGNGTQINQEYNAGGTGANTYKWNLSAAQQAADYSGGQGKVAITTGNKTNLVDKIVVRSVKFIVDTIPRLPILSPATEPLTVKLEYSDGSNTPLLTATPAQYNGMSVKFVDLPADFGIRGRYNRVTFKVECYTDAAGTVPATNTGNLFSGFFVQPWGGFTADETPGYGTSGRLQTFNGTTAAAGENGQTVTISDNNFTYYKPAGFRVERSAASGAAVIEAIKIVSVTFSYVAP